MSETVRYKGMLHLIPKVNKEDTLDVQCKRLIEKEVGNAILPTYVDSYTEWLMDDYSDKYYIYQNNLYLIDSVIKNSDDSFFEAEQKDAENIAFHVMYYNGGCNLSEALTEAIEKMK